MDIPDQSFVINCSTSISPITVENILLQNNNIIILSLADLLRVKKYKLALPDFVLEARKYIQSNHADFAKLFNLLRDDISKDIFNKIMNYRLTSDYNNMRSFSVRLSDQYFEPFAKPPHNAVLFDCGGFDGDTTEEFIKRNPDYKEVYLFEPSPENLSKARLRLKNSDNIKFIELGVSSEDGYVSFNSLDGSASAVADNGLIKIPVTTLDSYLTTKGSFIKMDLEGWELKALRGAKRHILEDKAILAIAVYHHISDFIEIPKYILSIQPNYDVFLRHYTEGWSETVMYFVPN